MFKWELLFIFGNVNVMYIYFRFFDTENRIFFMKICDKSHLFRFYVTVTVTCYIQKVLNYVILLSLCRYQYIIFIIYFIVATNELLLRHA